MAHDHTRINLAIWGDDDFTDLTPTAQHLFFALWTSPSRSYCGSGPWHAGRISQLAHGWTADDVNAAAAELSDRLFLVIDEVTDEYLLRSWVKHDGLWRTPNMAVSVAKARAELASKTLRAVVVHEVRKLAKANPESSSWTRETVREMLAQKAIDPATLDRFSVDATLPLTVAPTLVATPPATVAVTLAPTTANPPANPPANPSSNPAPTTATTTTTSDGGYVSREPHQSEIENLEPPSKCDQHPTGTAAPCRGCADAREAHSEWVRRNQAARYQRAVSERDERHRAERAEIDACSLCDDRGYVGTRVCDHDPDAAKRARAGSAKVRAALAATRGGDA